MGSRKARDVSRDPQPQSLHLYRLTFVDNIVVDARAADLREERAHCRMALRRRSERRRCRRRGAREANLMIGPALARDPFKSVEALGRVVTANLLLTLTAPAAAPIPVDA